MDDDDVVKHLIITGVKFTDRKLDGGAYGKVFAVDYNGITCAAKQTHSILIQLASTDDSCMRQIKKDFLQECLLHSKLHHPNIVKMLGVYYPNDQAVLPVLVMELMECNLTQLLENYQNIPMYVKLSILQDVSRAICYLHSLNPPMVHRDLSSNNILLTTSLVAKVSDFVIMNIVSPLSRDRMTTVVGHSDFMAPEVLLNPPHYGLPLDVFSFACVVCHVITQKWPRPTHRVAIDHKTYEQRLVSEVERRQQYIDQFGWFTSRSCSYVGLLIQLVITCLDDDPKRRPPVSVVSEKITSIITG